eukprot:1195800-Prorocentrum_minimum.AAC.6
MGPIMCDSNAVSSSLDISVKRYDKPAPDKIRLVLNTTEGTTSVYNNELLVSMNVTNIGNETITLTGAMRSANATPWSFG